MAEVTTTLENHPEDQIRVKNPTNLDFTFTWDSIPHTIKAGGEETYSRYLAVHYAKKMIVALVNARSRRVREGGTWKDTLRVDDVRVQKELLPHILLYVVKRFVEPISPERQRAQAEGEFDLEQFNVSEEKRASDLKIEIPKEEEEKIFGQEIEAPKIAAPEKADDQGKPATKKKFTLEELQDEARANGIEITGEETKEELEGMIVDSGGGTIPEEEQE